MKKILTLLFVFICTAAWPNKVSHERALTGTDVLIIGIPFYKPAQLPALKVAIQSIPDIQLVYVCQQEKTFLVKYDSLEYPNFDFFVDKIKQVDSTFVVYQKFITTDEFVNLCQDEVQKQ